MRRTYALPAFLIVTCATNGRAQGIRDDRDFFRPSTQQWSFDVSLSTFFDSNIERDELEQAAQGVESGFVARYQDRGERHRFSVRYKGGAQFYNHSDRWDGGRSDLEAVLERNVGSRFILGGIGGHSLKVSSEDNELVHELTATPLLEYEATRSIRLLTYGGFELRRPAAAEDVQRIRTAGAEIATELGDVSLFRFGYRYETSDSERSSRRYDRNSLVAGYDADLGRTALRFELEYRERRYPERLVDAGEIEVPRLDVDWIPSASWDYELPGGHRFRLKYEYETRTSNDPSKAYSGHRLELNFRVPLKGRVSVRPDPRRGDGLGLRSHVEADEVRVLSEHEGFRPIEGQRFSRGSDWKDVLHAQGVPTNISERPRFYEELWFYGDSWVVLKGGRVISWHDTGNLNLAPEPIGRPADEGGKPDQQRPLPSQESSQVETLPEIAARKPNDDSRAHTSASTRTEEPPQIVEPRWMAVARIAPSQIVLKDGTRIEGRIHRYENGLAYIIIPVGPNGKSLLTTLPEELIDRKATDQAKTASK